MRVDRCGDQEVIEGGLWIGEMKDTLTHYYGWIRGSDGTGGGPVSGDPMEPPTWITCCKRVAKAPASRGAPPC